jgi:hypothetical protein
MNGEAREATLASRNCGGERPGSSDGGAGVEEKASSNCGVDGGKGTEIVATPRLTRLRQFGVRRGRGCPSVSCLRRLVGLWLSNTEISN